MRLVIAFLALLVAGAAWGAVSYQSYTLQPGDTIEGVAARFHLSPQALRQFNALADGASLSAGQALAIPSSPAASRPTQAAGLPSGWLGVVVASRAEVRRQPGSGMLLAYLRKGQQVMVVTEKGNHYGLMMIDGSVGWAAKRRLRLERVELFARLPSRAQASSQGVVREAFRYYGVPYRYGGNAPGPLDCSALVQVTFAASGIRLPRTAAEQSQVGLPVPAEQLQPGDRLYFAGKNGAINHTGIYIGAGQFIHASSLREAVAVDYLASPTFWRRFVGARR